MNITTLKKILPVLNEARLTPWIWGYHGKGKSETIETYYKENGWLVFNFRLNTQADVGDFLGLQDFVTDDKGNKIATKFCMPEWLKQAMDFCTENPTKRACIFLDEVNRAPRMDLIGPVFQMALDRKLHTYDFSHLNIDIIAASNPDTGNYAVLSLDDKALFSRFVHIYFSPTVDEWRDYAVHKKYDTSIPDFIAEQPNFLEEKDLDIFSISEYAKPDRRKWGGVDRLLKANLPRNEQFEVFCGMIGNEAASAFYKFLDRDDKPLTLEEIFSYNKKTKKRVLKYVENNRTDTLHNVNQKILDFFKSPDKLADDAGDNLMAYMEDLPLPIMFNLAHHVYKERRFYEYAERNPTRKATFIKRLKEARSKVDKEETKPAEIDNTSF